MFLQLVLCAKYFQGGKRRFQIAGGFSMTVEMLHVSVGFGVRLLPHRPVWEYLAVLKVECEL